jgi:hypothetical protein
MAVEIVPGVREKCGHGFYTFANSCKRCEAYAVCGRRAFRFIMKGRKDIFIEERFREEVV